MEFDDSEYEHLCIAVWDIDQLLPAAREWMKDSVSSGCKFPVWFRFGFQPKPDRGNGSYHMNNPDCWKWAGCTTNNRAFQDYNFGPN